jgi:transposase-like protein
LKGLSLNDRGEFLDTFVLTNARKNFVMENRTLRPGPGQPTRYRPEYWERARKLCEGGATNADLAKEFGVARRTIVNWMAEHREFREAIEIARHGVVKVVKFSATLVLEAKMIARYAPDLAEPLLGDTVSFNEALQEARRRKAVGGTPRP